MSDKKVNAEDLNKALDAIASLTKGHGSKGTSTTKVEAMSGESGATQVFHTPSNSDPGSWAGSKAEAVSENGATDSVSENGTDLERGVMKSIMDKIAKGQPVTASEYAILKSAMFGKKDAQEPDEDDAKVAKGSKPFKSSDEDDEDDEDTKKSLSDIASENAELKSALEVSDFLSEWNGAISKALQGSESRTSTKVDLVMKSVMELASAQSAYNDNLAKALHGLLSVVTQQAQRIEQVESTPARGPKSVQVSQSMEKSMGSDEQLTKSQVADALCELVMKSEVAPNTVLRFESTGQIDPGTLGKVKAHLAGRK